MLAPTGARHISAQPEAANQIAQAAGHIPRHSQRFAHGLQGLIVSRMLMVFCSAACDVGPS
jgi:hypothetical protein